MYRPYQHPGSPDCTGNQGLILDVIAACRMQRREQGSPVRVFDSYRIIGTLIVRFVTNPELDVDGIFRDSLESRLSSLRSVLKNIVYHFGILLSRPQCLVSCNAWETESSVEFNVLHSKNQAAALRVEHIVTVYYGASLCAVSVFNKLAPI